VFVRKTRGWNATRRQRIVKGREGQKKASHRGLIHLYRKDIVSELYDGVDIGMRSRGTGDVLGATGGVWDFIRGHEPEEATHTGNTKLVTKS
jgi:hypothetical protein